MKSMAFCGGLVILFGARSMPVNIRNLAQAKNYVVAYKYLIGLLINFGSTSLEFKKIFNNRPGFSGLKDG